MTARLHVDWTRCDGRGLCTELLPDVLTRDDWGYPLVRDRAREPEIGPQTMRYAEAAVKRCPRLALRLVEGGEHAAVEDRDDVVG